MKIIATADTHNHILDIQESCDLFIHSGDLTINGTYDELMPQLDWIASIDAVEKMVIAGNHDFGFESDPDYWNVKMIERDIFYLENDYVEVSIADKSYNILGFPYVPNYGEYSFMRSEAELTDMLADMVSKIGQTNIDIMISHGPAYSYLDYTFRNEHAGCCALRDFIDIIQPSYMFHGHIHESRGMKILEYPNKTVTLLNVSSDCGRYPAVAIEI